MVAGQGDAMKRIGKSISASRKVLVVAIALVASSTSSFAIGTAEQRAACAPDVFRLCRSEIPNIDRIIVCLRRERPNLSKSCQAVMDSPIAIAR
jgi:hypothetical protein